jgi:hypothetical protein
MPGAVRHVRFLLIWLLVLLVLASMVVTAAIAVDPYYIFGAQPIPGISEIKPRVEQRQEQAKRAQLPRICGRTLITGNSRLQNGIDPASPYWPEANRPVFNAAMAGAGTDRAVAMLRLSLETCRPHQMLVSVDFMDFMTSRTPTHAKPANPTSLWPHATAMAEATLNLDTLVDVVRTVAAQQNASSPHQRPDGFNPMADYAALVRHIGHSRLFVHKNDDYRARLRRQVPQSFDPKTGSETGYLATLLDLALRNKVEVTLAVPPYHTSLLQLLHEEGLEPAFVEWKLMLRRLAGAAQARGLTVRLFDFSATDPRIAEPVPSPEDRRRMRWYWESGHFTAALGELIIARIHNTTVPDQSPFGVELTLLP